MGKGDKRRPELIKNAYRDNYDKIFGKAKPGDSGYVIKPGGTGPAVKPGGSGTI